MMLSENQKKSLLDKLHTIGVQNTKCEVCGHDTWLVNDVVFELREFTGGQINTINDSKLFPVVPLSCSTCGNTRLLNALILGILGEIPSDIGGTHK